MLEPLQFDIDAYPGIKIKQRLEYYIGRAKEAMSILETDKKEAKSILQELKSNLDIEYNYYTKLRFGTVLLSFQENNYEVVYDYTDSIKRASAKLIRTNSYDHLRSNLYDIIDYLSYIEIDNIEDDSIYGHFHCKKSRDDFYNSGLDRKLSELLSLLLQFYSGPSKSKAKKIADVIGNYNAQDIRDYVNGRLIKKFL